MNRAESKYFSTALKMNEAFICLLTENANIFKNAYNEHYKADAVIVDDFTLINH